MPDALPHPVGCSSKRNWGNSAHWVMGDPQRAPEVSDLAAVP